LTHSHTALHPIPPTAPLPAATPSPAWPSLTYSGWRLTRLTEAQPHPVYLADKEEDADHAHPALRLVGAQTVLCEGYWPFRPTFAPRLLLGGVCLYTAAWAVHFTAAKTGPEPRPLSLGLPGDLTRIVERLQKGRTIHSIQLPTRPGLYHQRLIAWQAAVIQRFPTIEAIRYTLPIPDYHGYIRHLECALGYALPGLHHALADYGQSIQALMAQHWGAAMHKVQFDIPGSSEQKMGDLLSRENDFQLYQAAVGEERVMGMEDLPEVALSHEVARRTGSLIPCAVSVLGLPDPYMLRTDASYGCQLVPLATLR
jgi:hypothetical protein